MQAFHNQQAIKEKYLARVKAHALADEIIKGQYWEDGKGCAVGCTVHSGDHKAYETELGIPEWIARLEDTLFEGMSNERSKLFPEQFLSAINIGADLDKVKSPFVVFVLESTLENFDHDKFPDVKKAVDQCIEVAKNNWSDPAAAWSARAAAESARSAAWSATESARSAAWSAIESAEAAAWSATESARSAARSAAESARSTAYEKFADKLIELLKAEGVND